MPVIVPPIANSLLQSPLWRPDDLGRPIPDSPHAVSACLPTWQDNIDYEEQQPRVTSRLTTGYPRFVYNQLCRDLFALCERRFAQEPEQCLAFPSRRTAEQCAEFIRSRAAGDVGVHALEGHSVCAVRFPRSAGATGKAFWQHAGVGVSSRQAEAALSNRPNTDGRSAQETIRVRLAEASGFPAENILLFPTGMAALYELHRALRRMSPERKSVQCGFPYVDALKVQQCFGPGAHFFPRGDATEMDALETLLELERVSAIFTELPTNPLLGSPDLERLSRTAKRANCPLVVDDTVASCLNVDVRPVADAVWTSLTKYFSGSGDVTGGALLISPESSFTDQLLTFLRSDHEDLLWGEDAVVLAANSAGFAERVAATSLSAEKLADHLAGHRRVARVHYPKHRDAALFRAFQRPGGGYGGLLSLEVADAPNRTIPFFNRLRVSKGPNLGTAYTLACPFTLLAHYNELDFAESCGVSRWLVRVAVGLEPVGDLISRFDEALQP